MTMKSSSKSEIAGHITVTYDKEDDSFVIELDENNPDLKFLESWTQDDFLKALTDFSQQQKNGEQTRERLPEESVKKSSNAKSVARKKAPAKRKRKPRTSA